MNSNTVLQLLKSNSKEVCDESVRILIKVIDNVIKEPDNLKMRCLQKDNRTVKCKIIQVKGGIDCLKLMGFVDDNTSFSLPTTISLNNLQKIKTLLNSLWTTPNSSDNKPSSSITAKKSEDEEFDNNFPDINKIKRFVLPPLKPRFTNPFLRRVESLFHTSLAFGDVACQKRARKLIPLQTLERNAQDNLRSFQEKLKREKLPDMEVSIQDVLILQLLAWFKNEFFSWVDTPPCETCNGKTELSHMSSDPADLQFTTRVEVYKCTACSQITKFPRYNDLNLLLETRRGRCGEWGQVFTLFCLALNWDARYVIDESDHVWTEVFSTAQQRWLHCDPCEKVCDKPLMYETGWNKKITYIMAYSPDEVQDVTWRYTANFKETLKRRTYCTEQQLVDAIMTLRTDRQKEFSSSKRNYLNRRVLAELLELLVERKPKDGDMQGRISGSEEWRSARGEIRKDNLFVWMINNCDIIDNKLTVKYSTACDAYHFVKGNGDVQIVKGWQSGVLSCWNIFRKEEKDWKTVYLSRNEGADKASISWKFQLFEDVSKVIDKVSLQFSTKIYENGVVSIELIADNVSIIYPNDKDRLVTDALSGKSSFTIKVDLYGGKGSVAWQHTQLFRQPIESNEFPFILSLTFK